MMKYIFKNRILQMLIHILVWGLFLSLLTSLVPRPPNMNPFLSILIPDLFFISFYYLNYFYLVPRYFIPKKFVLFGFICTGCLILTITVPSSISGSSFGQPELHEPGKISQFRPGPPPDDINMPRFREHNSSEHYRMPPLRIRIFIPEFSYSIFVFLFILTLSTGIRILLQWQQSEKEKVKAELSFLKAQINPHFLFNTLNSIYSMAVTRDYKTPDAIELFSDLMRYVLYESSHDFIPVVKKLQYIDTYIALQSLRLSTIMNVNYHKSGEAEGLMIAPLTLMPFIENAFKYGVSTEKESFIDIGIEINDCTLTLTICNSKTNSGMKEIRASQLGIENTKKRLNLIYPGKCDLKIIDSPDQFNVHLQLKLK
jgi:hypothetical protein